MAERRAGLVLGTIAFVALSLVLIRVPILYGVGDFLIVNDELQRADVIHVIAGPDEKTDYAVRLYRQGYGRILFFTGGWCNIHNSFHGQRGRDRALQLGVPPEAIAIDDSPVTSTYGEVVSLKMFIARSETPIRSVIAVSDSYHMRRARWTYRRVLGNDVELRMAGIPFELSPYKRRWWEDALSRTMVEYEYLKILFYYARYKFAWGSLREWLASFDRY